MSLDELKLINLSHFPATKVCAGKDMLPYLDTPGLVGELPEEAPFPGVMQENVSSRTTVAILLL